MSHPHQQPYQPPQSSSPYPGAHHRQYLPPQGPGVPAQVAGVVISSTHITIAWVVTACTFGYMLPWAIAASRQKSNSVAIAILAGLTGWTGVGWVIALVMACAAEPQRVSHHYTSYPQYHPGQYSQPGYPQAPGPQAAPATPPTPPPSSDSPR